MLQLHLSDQQVYCLLRCNLYERFDSTLIIYIFTTIFSKCKRWKILSSFVDYIWSSVLLKANLSYPREHAVNRAVWFNSINSLAPGRYDCSFNWLIIKNWLISWVFPVKFPRWAPQDFIEHKLSLCSANHRTGYFNNLACDWLSIFWAYSEQETENGPR